jgi:hypothetical protein
MAIKHCEDCEHFERVDGDSRCHAPDFLPMTRHFIDHDWPKPVIGFPVYIIRFTETMCGLEARWFDPKTMHYKAEDGE